MDNPPTVIISQPPPQPFFPSSPPFPQPENATIISSPPAPLPFSSSSSSPQTQIYPVTIVTINQPPPFPDSPRSVDFSPLEFILVLMAVITIPALIYAFFFADVKCPRWSSSSSSSYSSSDRQTQDDDLHSHIELPVVEATEPVSGLKYKKETHSKEIGNECSVCLSVFADGEEVKQLSLCKHSFHTTCIDLWLTNHNNCPICRATVDVNRPNNNRGPSSGTARDGGGDHHQGLPDAASLV